MGGFRTFGRHDCSTGTIDEMRTEVMLVDKVVTEGMIGCVTDGAVVAAIDTRYGAVLNVIQPFVTMGENGVAEGARIRWRAWEIV